MLKKGFIYTFQNELLKSVSALVSSLVVVPILSFVFVADEKVRNLLNNCMRSTESEIIYEG